MGAGQKITTNGASEGIGVWLLLAELNRRVGNALMAALAAFAWPSDAFYGNPILGLPATGNSNSAHSRRKEADMKKTISIALLYTFGKFFELVKTNPYAPLLATVRNVMALPGAVAFKPKNAIVGALGVGGAPGGDKDDVCAHAGVTKVADRLPN